MQFDVPSPNSGREQIGNIPVWSHSIGSWRFAVGRTPLSADELEGRYDEASETWQTTISRLGFDAAYADLIDQVMPLIPNKADLGGLHVLDAGIGTGAMSCAFASQCRYDFELIGMDVSSEMLRHADENLQRCNVKARLVQGDLNALPFADNTFDVVMVAHVLEHMVDPEMTLSKLCGVLKPGGVLIACITRRSSAGAYIQFKWRTHRVGNNTAIRWFERCGLRSVRNITFNRSLTARRLSSGYFGIKTVPTANHRENRSPPCKRF